MTTRPGCAMQVLVAEDPTTLCTDAKAVAGRQSLIAVLIPLPDNIMSFMLLLQLS